MHKNNGSTLIVSLIVLLLVLLLGIAVANLALTGEKSARNAHDRTLALFAAESALIDAERDIENSTAPTSRSALFSPHSAVGFSDSCGSGERNPYQGLCLNGQTAPSPIWQSADIANTGTNSVSVQFGRFTGRTMPTGHGAGPGHLPRYVIELMLDTGSGQIAEQAYLYRITAIGFGFSSSTQVVVQSLYRKSFRQSRRGAAGEILTRSTCPLSRNIVNDDSLNQKSMPFSYANILNFRNENGESKITEATETELKCGRLSWREIQNWQGSK